MMKCFVGLFGQSSTATGGFRTVKTDTNISGAFSSGGGGSIAAAGFGAFQHSGNTGPAGDE